MNVLTCAYKIKTNLFKKSIVFLTKSEIKKTIPWASEMAQQVMVATTKSDDLSSIHRTHTLEELTSVKLSSG